jgi:hypothetical protein
VRRQRAGDDVGGHPGLDRPTDDLAVTEAAHNVVLVSGPDHAT